MKKYGIYLAYSPTVILDAEGLGRHLIEFLKGAQSRKDLYFVIACPSWMRKNLTELFQASDILPTHYELFGPTKKPFVFILFEKYHAFNNRPRKAPSKSYLQILKKYITHPFISLRAQIQKKIITTRNANLFFLIGIIIPFFFTILVILRCIFSVFHLLNRFFTSIQSKIKKYSPIEYYIQTVKKIVHQPKSSELVLKMHQLMYGAETLLMIKMINHRKDIQAWYSPTAFWPLFNQIKAPRLLCVPDVVLGDFPIGFSAIGGNRVLETFKQVEETIQNGEHFVTYSENIKWNTLIKRYGCDPSSVLVIPHGANRLDKLITVSGLHDNKTSTQMLCRTIFHGALHKAIDGGTIYKNNPNASQQGLRFLFYASQFRPNKNIIILLRVYNYLLKERFLGIKLVLTGSPQAIPEIGAYIKTHGLENDVLCLHGLSNKELAACYKLADLAVNPSFSEGGCPFTFTEALSVGTPVVMARIPVSEEVITCPDLQEIMFFDPYDWEEMADRIEWGLKNRSTLLAKQQLFYDVLKERTWKHVVDEHIQVLDLISNAESATKSQVQSRPKTKQPVVC